MKSPEAISNEANELINEQVELENKSQEEKGISFREVAKTVESLKTKDPSPTYNISFYFQSQVQR